MINSASIKVKTFNEFGKKFPGGAVEKKVVICVLPPTVFGRCNAAEHGSSFSTLWL